MVLFIFLIVRKLQGIGYTFSLRKKDIPIILFCYLAGGIIIVPIGLYTDFFAFTSRIPDLGRIITGAIGIFFSIGLVEELLFRGIIHNLIQKTIKSYNLGPQIALVISSVIFGAAHLNNLGGGDMRYFFLATIAGYFYGLAFVKAGNIIPAALVHTFYDLTWVLFFSK
jgi:membrane protease YdiL (CAAX protease family)